MSLNRNRLPNGTRDAMFDKRESISLAGPVGLAPCPSMDFTCEDGSCIPKTSVCDGYDDCPKAEDELHCGTYSLSFTTF